VAAAWPRTAGTSAAAHDSPGRTPRLSLRDGRLVLRDGRLVLDLPSATEAVVPQRPLDIPAAPHPDAADQ
jgi:hypothetical protein